LRSTEATSRPRYRTPYSPHGSALLSTVACCAANR
jgi:hypothetical protein